MIDALTLENFRSIERLELTGLKRVVLFTGKNNVGKTALLEAIYLHSYQYATDILQILLASRNEWEESQERFEDVLLATKNYGGIINNKLQSWPLGNVFSEFRFNGTKSQITYELFAFKEERVSNTIHRKNIDISTPLSGEIGIEYRVGLRIVRNNNETVYDVDRNTPVARQVVDGFHRGRVRYVRGMAILDVLPSMLWEKIAFTLNEEILLNALRIIEPKIKGLIYTSAPWRTRTNRDADDRVPKFVLNGSIEKQNLGSMGDGINRVLEIMLALVNCKDGVLLIDEFENGLHYSVMEDLWKMVFAVAHQLNVQVFATTHSSDCISAFRYASLGNNELGGQYVNDAALVKLNRKPDGSLKAIHFTEAELDEALKHKSELR